MTVQMGDDGAVELTGDCPSGDAEALLRHLAARPTAAVDWRECKGAHTAVVQILIAARIRPTGPPASAFLANWVEPLLKRR
jgi:hypothetical protein